MSYGKLEHIIWVIHLVFCEDCIDGKVVRLVHEQELNALARLTLPRAPLIRTPTTRMMFLRRLPSFRFSQLSAQTIHRSTCRPFATSFPRLASISDVPPKDNSEHAELLERLSKTEGFKKLSKSPDALKALQEFNQVMQEQGTYLTTHISFPS